MTFPCGEGAQEEKKRGAFLSQERNQNTRILEGRPTFYFLSPAIQ